MYVLYALLESSTSCLNRALRASSKQFYIIYAEQKYLRNRTISVCSKALLWGKTHSDWLDLAPYALPGTAMAAHMPTHVKCID